MAAGLDLDPVTDHLISRGAAWYGMSRGQFADVCVLRYVDEVLGADAAFVAKAVKMYGFQAADERYGLDRDRAMGMTGNPLTDPREASGGSLSGIWVSRYEFRLVRPGATGRFQAPITSWSHRTVPGAGRVPARDRYRPSRHGSRRQRAGDHGQMDGAHRAGRLLQGASCITARYRCFWK